MTKEELEAIYKNFGDGELDYLYAKFNIDIIKNQIKDKVVLEMSTNIYSSIQLSEYVSCLDVVDGSSSKIETLSTSVMNAVTRGRCKNVTMYNSLFEDFVPPKKYDEIVLFRALEHVDNPVKLLKRAKTWLKPRGAINIVVPNKNSLHKKLGFKLGLVEDLDELTSADYEKGHKRIYDSSSLLADVRAARFGSAFIRGCFVKMFSDSQIKSNPSLFTPSVLKALFEISEDFDEECCAELFVRALND